MVVRRLLAGAFAGTLLSLAGGTGVALAAGPYPPPGAQQAFDCTNPAGNARGHSFKCEKGSTSTSVASDGASFEFSGPAVFGPGETLQLWMFSTGEQIGTINADSSGAFATTVTVPANLAPGAHKVEAIGNANGTIVVADFTVPAAAGATTTGSPALPFTGADVLPLSSAGAGLLLAGGLTVMVVRRRRPRSGHTG